MHLTLEFNRRKSGWSGVVWARHWRTSAKYRNWKARKRRYSNSLKVPQVYFQQSIIPDLLSFWISYFKYLMIPGPQCHLSCLVIVLQLADISPRGLCNPLASYEVSYNHRRRTNICILKRTVQYEENNLGNKQQFSLQVPYITHSGVLTWLFLSRLGQVGNTGVGTHQDVTRMQSTLQKALLCFWNMNSSERSLWQSVGWHQGKAVHTYLVNAINCLHRN